MQNLEDEDSHELTRLIHEARSGDNEAYNRLFEIVYDRLKGLARNARFSWPADSSLSTTSLVHEFFLKYNRSKTVNCEDRQHFYSLAVRMMRQILINSASKKRTQKRGGDVVRADYFEDLAIEFNSPEDIIITDQLLTKLEGIDKTMSTVFEYVRFGQMTQSDTAEALGISVSTVKRNLKRAEAWLYNAMQLSKEDGEVKSS